MPWIGIKDATENHGRVISDTYQHTNELGIANSSARILPAHTVCLSRTASVGYVVVMGRPMATSQDFVNWVCSEAIDYRFLTYVLLAERDAFLRFASGTTHQTIYFPEVKAFHVCLAPIEEQRAIAHILGSLDDKIELNRRMSETLEAMVQAIFKSWFVDFDPVRAKAEGRDAGVPKPLADLFSDSFENSELEEIPKGWQASKVGDEVATVLGGTPSRAEPRYWGGDIPWINSGKANEFRVVEPSEFITKDGLDSSATKLLPSRTTVIAITGATLGQVSLTEIATCANQSIVGVIGGAALPSEFLYFWVRNRIHDLLASQTGGAQQHINKNDVNDLPVLVPSEPIIEAFIAQARPCFDRIKECCLESRTLTALRDMLLPKLISGELRVKDAERVAGADG